MKPPINGDGMSTVRELLKLTEELLKEGGCDSPSFDALCLLEDVAGIGRGNVPSAANSVLDDTSWRRVLDAAKRRAAGEPLQYLLGSWDFLSLTLEVGEGVLVPRPETELLCEVAAEHLHTASQPVVLDLCAGSGCVGLGIASLCPSAKVTCIEKSPQAFHYLQNNIARYPQYAVTPLVGDVLCDYQTFNTPVDALVSNPPYIPKADLKTLQREVQHEPSMALDGGEDGLTFYRVIANEWSKHVRSGGFIAVEIGIGQSEDVARLFADAGLINIRVYKDFAEIDRVIFAECV